MTRILALDVGDSRIGVALSDLTATIATPFGTVLKQRGVYQELAKIVKEQSVVTLVIGLPLTAEGKSGDQVEKTRRFTEKLTQELKRNMGENAPNLVEIDERFTSKQAEAHLRLTGQGQHKKKLDQLAACFILEAYLENKYAEQK